MNANELTSQAILILCGGLIGTTSAIIANHFLHRAQKAHEDLVYWKNKLEEFTSSVLAVDPWLNKYCNATIAEEDVDETDTPILQFKMLATLYFPEYSEDVTELEKGILAAQTTALHIRKSKPNFTDSETDYRSLTLDLSVVQELMDKILFKIQKDPTIACTVRRTTGRIRWLLNSIKAICTRQRRSCAPSGEA